jgi:hypothetical protein
MLSAGFGGIAWTLSGSKGQNKPEPATNPKINLKTTKLSIDQFRKCSKAADHLHDSYFSSACHRASPVSSQKFNSQQKMFIMFLNFLFF